jgi:hypothetical protein
LPKYEPYKVAPQAEPNPTILASMQNPLVTMPMMKIVNSNYHIHSDTRYTSVFVLALFSLIYLFIFFFLGRSKPSVR